MGACAVVENGLPVLVGWVNILCAESGWDEYHERMGGDSADRLVLRVFLEGDTVRDVLFQVGRHSVGRGWLQVDRGAKHLRKAGGDGLTDFAVRVNRLSFQARDFIHQPVN